jgi:hypothetical protein
MTPVISRCVTTHGRLIAHFVISYPLWWLQQATHDSTAAVGGRPICMGPWWLERWLLVLSNFWKKLVGAAWFGDAEFLATLQLLVVVAGRDHHHVLLTAR